MDVTREYEQETGEQVPEGTEIVMAPEGYRVFRIGPSKSGVVWHGPNEVSEGAVI